MGRTPCCSKIGLKRGPWTPEEDRLLISYIQKYGHDNWRALPKHAGLLRCGKSCRLRWMNYLRPDIKRGNFSTEEENAIINLHEELGNRWSAIAARLPGRTDNEIKNVWHTYLKKRLLEDKDDKNNNNNNNNKDVGTEASTAMPEFSSPQRSSGTEFLSSSSMSVADSSPIPELPDSPPLVDDWFWWDELEELLFPVSPVREAEPWVLYSEGSEGVNGAGGIDFWYNLYARTETSSNF